jgi:hypothetical protein
MYVRVWYNRHYCWEELLSPDGGKTKHQFQKTVQLIPYSRKLVGGQHVQFEKMLTVHVRTVSVPTNRDAFMHAERATSIYTHASDETKSVKLFPAWPIYIASSIALLCIKITTSIRTHKAL